jgi:c(7)-type cytochrome triheme protein
MRFLLVFLVLFVLSCSTSSRQIFFDIPPPNEQELAEKARQEAARSEALSRQEANGSGGFSTPQDNLPPPDVESHLSWARAQEELPENELGGIDWTAALEQGLIRPRTGADPKAKDAAAFKYDFIIEGKKPKFDAIFPHSAHTAWLGCQNCHTALYPYRRNTAKMKEMRKGASCGACHGKVAFSLKQCKRCHINM